MHVSVNSYREIVDLSRLCHERSYIDGPRWRLQALLALIPAARRLGVDSERLRREARQCLDRIVPVGKRADMLARRKAAVSAYAVLDDYLKNPAAERFQDFDTRYLQRFARIPFLSPSSAALIHAGTFLRVGWIAEARSFAANAGDAALCHRVWRHVETRVLRDGVERHWIGCPFNQEVPHGAELPLFVAMARAARPDAPLDEEQRHQAESLLTRLDGRDRQRALPHWSVAVFHDAGLEAALTVISSVRYRSERERGRFLVLQAALRAGHLSTAWKVFAGLRGEAFKERARLELAAVLIRRSKLHPARRLLAAPFDDLRRAERDLLLARIHLHRGDEGEAVARLLISQNLLTAQATEDLSRYNRALLGLARRQILLLAEIWRYQDFPRPRYLLTSEVYRLAFHRFTARSFLRHTLGSRLDEAELAYILRRTDDFAPGTATALRSEYICWRAQSLGHRHEASNSAPPTAQAFLRGLRSPRAAEEVPPKRHENAASRRRAAFDEGLSLSAGAERQRKVLVHAAKYCLKQWMSSPEPTSQSALRSRLRGLRNLGGSYTVTQLTRSLKEAPSMGPTYLAAFAALATLDPHRAACFFFQEQAEMFSSHPEATWELLRALEDRGALEVGFARRWAELIHALRERRDDAWLGDFMAAWRAEVHTFPRLGSIAGFLRNLEQPLPERGAHFVIRARRNAEYLLERSPFKLLETLMSDRGALAGLLGRVPEAYAHRWSDETWSRALVSVARALREVDVRLLYSLARRLAPQEQAIRLARSWFLGRFPVDGPAVMPLPYEASVRGTFRVRYLDKRRDLFTFLRLADAAKCCFNSSSTWLRRSYRWYHLSILWQDPLSFCFHLEHRLGKDHWTPSGFVFGSYALVGTQPAVVLNGLYLRRQNARLRAGVLAAIEDSLCRPLGIRHVAVANRHTGYGALPATYVQDVRGLTRLRALRNKGRRILWTYDDVSRLVNRPTVLSHLYWRRLE